MKKGRSIGKIFGIALVFAMIGALLPFSGFVTQNRALAQSVTVPVSLELFGAGARWAAQISGGTALYVNWQDNLYLHPNPEYEGPTPTEPNSGDSISYILEEYGFDVQFAGDIPADLSEYSVVVITAYWAVEPANEPVIRDYISEGGGVVLNEAVPCYFVTYCKDWWPGIGSLAPIQDWFGAGWYTNAGGYASVAIDSPFGVSLTEGDILVEGVGYSCAAVSQLQPGAETIAEWGTGQVFSFAHETIGRLYYQSFCEELNTTPRTIYVPDDYSTIQAAVNAADSGDTIIVRDDTYTENVNVNKDHLTIQSENGAGLTIVQAANPSGDVFAVTADYVNISAFTAKGGHIGIHLIDAQGCQISENLCTNNYWGIRLDSCQDTTLTHNEIRHSGDWGIHLRYSSGNTIRENDSSMNGAANICLWYSNENVIEENTCSLSGWNGIILLDSKDNLLEDNACSDNDWSGIDLSSSSQNTLRGNTCARNGHYGIFLAESSSNIVTDNTCFNNGMTGIRLRNNSNNTIYLNNFVDNAPNVYSEGSTNTWNSPEPIT